MTQIVQLNEADVMALELGRLVFQGVANASKVDMMERELDQIKQKLEALEAKAEDVKEPSE